MIEVDDVPILVSQADKEDGSRTDPRSHGMGTGKLAVIVGVFRFVLLLPITEVLEAHAEVRIGCDPGHRIIDGVSCNRSREVVPGEEDAHK